MVKRLLFAFVVDQPKPVVFTVLEFVIAELPIKNERAAPIDGNPGEIQAAIFLSFRGKSRVLLRK